MSYSDLDYSKDDYLMSYGIDVVRNHYLYEINKHFYRVQNLSDANKPISDADNRLKGKRPAVPIDDKTFTELAFATAASYTTSYGIAVKGYIEGVSNKQKLLKYASDILAMMQEKKTHTGKYSYLTMEMELFLSHQGINWDKTGNDYKLNKDEWGVNIEYLNHWIKNLSNEVETDVIKLNDIINKQNQILQSTTTVLKKIQSMLEAMLKNFT